LIDVAGTPRAFHRRGRRERGAISFLGDLCGEMVFDASSSLVLSPVTSPSTHGCL
jgi:hypothetical protein